MGGWIAAARGDSVFLSKTFEFEFGSISPTLRLLVQCFFTEPAPTIAPVEGRPTWGVLGGRSLSPVQPPPRCNSSSITMFIREPTPVERAWGPGAHQHSSFWTGPEQPRSQGSKTERYFG